MDDPNVVTGIFRVIHDGETPLNSPDCFQGDVLRKNGSAVIIDLDMLRTEMTLTRLMSLEHPQVREVPEELISEWNLRHADRVDFDVINNQLVILRVWDKEDPEGSQCRPEYGNLVRGQVFYPSLELPLEDRKLWAARLLAPPGLGSQYFIAGPYGSGKTTTSQQMLREMLLFNQRLLLGEGDFDPRWKEIARKIVYVVGQFGERNTDTNDMRELLKIFPNLPIYHFCPPHGHSGKHENRNTADFAIALTERLYELGYHVALIEDSLRGLALEVFAPHAPQGSGLSPGGIQNFALEHTKNFAAHAGDGGRRSITGFFTALSAERTQGGHIFEEAGGPESTSALMHLQLDVSVKRPWLDPFHPSETRKIERMLTGDRLELHYAVQRLIARRKPRDSRQPPVDALNSLHELVDSASGCSTFEQATGLWLSRLSSTVHRAAVQSTPPKIVAPIATTAPLQTSLVVVKPIDEKPAATALSIEEAHESSATLEEETLPSVESMMATWATLRGHLPKLPYPSKNRCKKLLEKEGFQTLDEFETYITNGRLR